MFWCHIFAFACFKVNTGDFIAQTTMNRFIIDEKLSDDAHYYYFIYLFFNQINHKENRWTELIQTGIGPCKKAPLGRTWVHSVWVQSLSVGWSHPLIFCSQNYSETPSEPSWAEDSTSTNCKSLIGWKVSFTRIKRAIFLNLATAAFVFIINAF